MGDYEDIGNGFMGLFRLLIWVAVAAVPLAIWKLAEIIVWVCRHVSVSVG